MTTSGAQGTGAVAQRLAAHLRPGDVVLLTGGLATGKTTFVKALVTALDSVATVTSPTFTLAQFYESAGGTVLHIDAYRLSGIHEYRDLGLAEYASEAITLVEWGEKVAEDFPCHLTAEFRFCPAGPDTRLLEFSSRCDRWGPVLGSLRAEQLAEAKLT
ncbi:MAG TPA: tRNA (adenosine(37)-N6)-threonylcarbamoyltransferase complex ATPase subunit type 1 TsaE [Streptosporangiaceae bacterium]|nr:tRNA (adenosine(37)-N6)-threonylcarbamoyltransferase complex ATPase subunit type 1 TsaE [Streptosporangiaceae bacterium]